MAKTDIQKVVVCGGGVLGSQIAFQIAYCGFEVNLLLRSNPSIDRAKVKIERLRGVYLQTMEGMKSTGIYPKGLTNESKLSNEQIDELKQRVEKAYQKLVYTTSYEDACKNADLVIESIAEEPKQKIDLYEELAKHLEEKTILVSNSSTLLPSQFAAYTGRPEKYLSFHFANNIWKLNTVEIMGHPGTDHQYFETMCDFAEEMNMIPIRVLKEQPGYILNSLLLPLLEHAISLWVNGVGDFETIDKTWRLGTGSPHGPFQIIDVVGITTVYNIYLMYPDSKNPTTTHYKAVQKLKTMIDEGKLGINAGQGFYNYKQ